MVPRARVSFIVNVAVILGMHQISGRRMYSIVASVPKMTIIPSGYGESRRKTFLILPKSPIFGASVGKISLKYPLNRGLLKPVLSTDITAPQRVFFSEGLPEDEPPSPSPYIWNLLQSLLGFLRKVTVVCAVPALVCGCSFLIRWICSFKGVKQYEKFVPSDSVIASFLDSSAELIMMFVVGWILLHLTNIWNEGDLVINEGRTYQVVQRNFTMFTLLSVNPPFGLLQMNSFQLMEKGFLNISAVKSRGARLMLKVSGPIDPDKFTYITNALDVVLRKQPCVNPTQEPTFVYRPQLSDGLSGLQMDFKVIVKGKDNSMFKMLIGMIIVELKKVLKRSDIPFADIVLLPKVHSTQS